VQDPALAELARVLVGEEAQAASRGGQAGPGGQRAVAAERGVVGDVAGQRAARVGGRGQRPRDLAVHEAAPRRSAGSGRGGRGALDVAEQALPFQEKRQHQFSGRVALGLLGVPG
jgi:hypothetical protein